VKSSPLLGVESHLKRYLAAVKQQPQIQPSWWPSFGGTKLPYRRPILYPSMQHQLPRHIQWLVATQSTVGMSQTDEGFSFVAAV
jgi:hypothetical protein